MVLGSELGSISSEKAKQNLAKKMRDGLPRHSPQMEATTRSAMGHTMHCTMLEGHIASPYAARHMHCHTRCGGPPHCRHAWQSTWRAELGNAMWPSCVVQCVVRPMADRIVASIRGASRGKPPHTTNHVARGMAECHAFFKNIVDCVAHHHVVLQNRVYRTCFLFFWPCP